MIEYVTSGHITDRKKLQYDGGGELKQAETYLTLRDTVSHVAQKNDQL